MIESMIAERMGRLGTETAFEVLARARALERQGKSVVHLEIGEPDFDTPAHIREAAKRALDAGATHYGPSAGLPELREAIAEHIEKTRGVPVAPDEVVVTPGAKPIMFFVIMALANRGDEVVYPNPGFPIYESVINFVGGVPVPIPLLRGERLRLRPPGARAARLAEDQAHHHQLAGEPDGRRAGAGRRRPHRRPGAALRRARCCRTRSTGGSSTRASSRRWRAFPA